MKKSSREEVPVKTIKNRWSRKHPTETRIFRRDIRETYCTDPKCKFHGKRAAQGVCHTERTFSGSMDWSYIEQLEKLCEEDLKLTRKHWRGKLKWKVEVS